MRRTCLIGVAAVTLVTPVLAGAQGSANTAERQLLVVEGQAAGGSGRFIAGAVESRITPGRPYSAEAVTERTQVLADGNRIHVRSITRVFRDSDGRTRREMLETDGSVRSISISDPVGRNSYTLDPRSKVAYAAGGGVIAPMTATGRGGSYTTSAGGRGGGGTAQGTSVRMMAPTSTAVLMRTPGPENENVTREELGSQNIEGIMATGTRVTTIIPAGQIGNAQEIRIVSEQWFSDELQALVLTRHTDPRSGENVYKLQNILRAEPDPMLFQVPADYTIQQRGVRRPQ